MTKNYYTSGRLCRVVRDAYDIRVTAETIRVKGYREWHAATYMTTNKNRMDCVDWVIGLIEKGMLRLPKAEICNKCGRSVKPGSGNWCNRVVDLNDAETRKALGRPFLEGDFVCAECENEETD